MAKDFLLEIGMEELPAKFIPGSLSQMEEKARKLLNELRLEFTAVEVYATPRRLALLVLGLAEKQLDLTMEVKGPAVKVAYDDSGKPTKAAQGFARGQGVEVETLFVQEINEIPYVFARKEEQGQETEHLLAQFALDLIMGLHFPKPMRWGSLDVRFARPLRWLVVLYGSEIIPVQLAGLVSGRCSRGHRTLSPQDIAIDQPAEYVEKLRTSYVLVDPQERKKIIEGQIQVLAQEVRGQVPEDEELLEEVIHLVEYPTALRGEVSERYMHLPKAVVTTPMREHQRYFPIRSLAGELLPYFITVRNGDDKGLATVKAGNEKVLKARLEDAAFYYREDQKVALADLVPKLARIVYHDKLGTMQMRTSRIQKLACELGQRLGLGSGKLENIERTAYLAKADLVTLMVYDFPELQGIMGADYASASGEKAEVCQGILEHYQPRFAGDELPASETGQVVSVADKLEAIVGAFGIGIQPTGSQDPYALRRQAQGIVGIWLAAQWELSLADLLREAYELFAEQELKLLPFEQIKPALQEFFRQRLRYVLQEQGLRYDTIEAVLSQDSDNLSRAARKANVLTLKRETEGFDAYAQAYVRCLNLTKKEAPQALHSGDLVDPVELTLAEEIGLRRERFDSLIGAGEYEKAYELTAELVPMIEELFQAVMIMADEQKLRQARLALLGQCVELLGCLGDLGVLA